MDIADYIRQSVMQAQSGRTVEAIAMMETAVREHPGSSQGLGLLGTLLLSVGRHAEALGPLSKAREMSPQSEHISFQLGAALVALDRPMEGLPHMKAAVDRNPSFVPSLLGFARALLGVGDFDRSEDVFRRALAVDPRNADAMCGLAGMMMVSGRQREAVELFRQAGREHPENREVSGRLLSALNYSADASPEEVFEAHTRWGRQVMALPDAPAQARTGQLGLVAPPAPFAFTNAKDPDKKLRVGLLSTDLFEHSVAYFLRSLLRWRDAARIEFICYSTTNKSDWMTAQLKSAADGWRVLAGLDDRGVVDKIREDRLDILVELGGHTANGPLIALRRRAAPVQVDYLGYPNTSGLPTIDWRIVDAATDPPGAEKYCTEKLARLEDCFLCYSGAEEQPEDQRGRWNQWAAAWGTPGAIAPPEQVATPTITFGSFNSIRKIGPEVVHTWSRILKSVPGSKLFIKTKGIGTPAARRNFETAFAREGIEPGRVELLEAVTYKSEHLRSYERVHIALDTFPYNGTTTTCEAMWMGVPVITLAGNTHAGRVGVSLLQAVGLPELIAKTPDDYISLAAGLAQDGARLAELRASVRDRMAGSALCDGKAFAAKFESALRMMWREWCRA